MCEAYVLHRLSSHLIFQIFPGGGDTPISLMFCVLESLVKFYCDATEYWSFVGEDYQVNLFIVSRRINLGNTIVNSGEAVPLISNIIVMYLHMYSDVPRFRVVVATRDMVGSRKVVWGLNFVVYVRGESVVVGER